MNHVPLIQIRGLVHDYGQGPVLDLPALDLGAGVHHLTGPNGAGKTTLLRILATLLRPTRGTATVAGHRLAQQAAKARAGLGYAGHDPALHPELSVRENLTLHARLHDQDPSTVASALSSWGLEDRAGDPVARLSRGLARRADLARATLHRPRVLLLDEPAEGLDAQRTATLGQRLSEAEAELVLIASHAAPPLDPDTHLRLEGGVLAEGPA